MIYDEKTQIHARTGPTLVKFTAQARELKKCAKNRDGRLFISFSNKALS